MRAVSRRLAVAALAGLAALGMALPAAAQKTTLSLGMVLEPPHLDPTAGAAAAIREVTYANIFEGLTRMDRNGLIKPALAESWAVTDDGLRYTFRLRSGVTFHDGKPMTSADVVFSFERAVAPDSTNAQKALFEPIAKVEAPDAGTVVITLKRPTSGFPFNLAWGDMVVVGRDSAASNKTNPVGTGPFRFVRWVKGDRVEVARNESYWGTKPALTAATFRFIADPAAATNAMMAGDVDAFPNFPAPESLPAFQADSRFKVVVGRTEGETILAMNNGRKPFDDVRVRRAISHAIDRKAIIDGAMFGLGTPIGSHFSPNHPAYVDLTGAYPFDVAKAKALLAEAGVQPGLRTTIKLPPPTYARRGGEVIAAQLKAIGIEAELVPIEWAQWLEQVFRNRDFDLTIISHTEPLDIDIYARETYYFAYKGDKLREIMKQIAETLDEGKRNALYGDAQRLITADAVNAYLFMLPKAGVWNARVQGLWENSPIAANDLTEVRWAN